MKKTELVVTITHDESNRGRVFQVRSDQPERIVHAFQVVLDSLLAQLKEDEEREKS
jgi:hypothetical protein